MEGCNATLCVTAIIEESYSFFLKKKASTTQQFDKIRFDVDLNHCLNVWNYAKGTRIYKPFRCWSATNLTMMSFVSIQSRGHEETLVTDFSQQRRTNLL